MSPTPSKHVKRSRHPPPSLCQWERSWYFVLNGNAEWHHRGQSSSSVVAYYSVESKRMSIVPTQLHMECYYFHAAICFTYPRVLCRVTWVQSLSWRQLAYNRESPRTGSQSIAGNKQFTPMDNLATLLYSMEGKSNFSSGGLSTWKPYFSKNHQIKYHFSKSLEVVGLSKIVVSVRQFGEITICINFQKKS